MTAVKPPMLPGLPVGGNVVAIIPQSLDEVFRVAEGVRKAGFAPASLIAQKTPEEAKAAIAIAIMAGAELGLPPMAALRSFTVIGGRPALFGDGLINVIRRSGRAKLLETGFNPGKDAEYGNDAVGWCRAARADTDETRVVHFSVADAKLAGLWDDREKYTNRYGKEVPNDTPWHRYPKRMLAWRAAGYCLRELFGDVLGGLLDEQEAREIAQSEGGYDGETIEGKVVSGMPPAAPPIEEEKSADAILDELAVLLKTCPTPEATEKAFDAFDVQAKLSGNDDALQSAFDMYKQRLAEVTPTEEEEGNSSD